MQYDEKLQLLRERELQLLVEDARQKVENSKKQEERRKLAFEREEERKKVAFEAEERRKEEIHILQMESLKKK